MGFIEVYGVNENPSSGNTRVCGIIGYPVGHTVSPLMQNAGFQHLGLDYVYVPFKVKPEDLGKAVRGVRALNIRGLNVTVPHKVEVIPFLDEIDPLAKNIGAVNTIVNDEGILKGYNTDAAGFLKALSAEGVAPEKKKVLVLGAGGAARAVTFILADRGADLIILNRSLDAARTLSDHLFQIFRRKVTARVLDRSNLKDCLAEAEIVVNTTSLGMMPDPDGTPVPASLLRPGLIVIDIIYNPVRTRLLYEAEKKGARIIGGLEMLVWQGAVAFELWTGQKAPVGVMKEAAVGALERVRPEYRVDDEK